MDIDIFRVIDQFFSRDLSYYSPENLKKRNDDLENLFKLIEDQFKSKINLGDLSKLENINEHSKIKNLLGLVIEKQFDIFKNNENFESLLEALKYFLQNPEEIIENLPNLDKDLYFNLNNFFLYYLKKNEVEVIKRLNIYYNSLNTPLSLEEQKDIIIIFRDPMKKIENNFDKLTLNDFFDYIANPFFHLENIDERSFKKYFTDFIGKFGSMIELYLKKCFLLMIKFTHNYIPEYKLERKTLGNLFEIIDTRKKYKKIDIFKHYRNSIQHYDFKYQYNKD